MPKYRAFFSGKQHDLTAPSLLAAKQAAVEHFKPRKRAEHMVSVVLVGRDDGSPVSLHESNADLG
jgi:hypothetical protein